MEVIPQSSSIGAEVRGLDLSGKLSDALIEPVNQASLDYQAAMKLVRQAYDRELSIVEG